MLTTFCPIEYIMVDPFWQQTIQTEWVRAEYPTPVLAPPGAASRTGSDSDKEYCG